MTTLDLRHHHDGGVAAITPVELEAQLDRSRHALERLTDSLPLIDRWGWEMRRRLERGHRLLVAGNGGSAALAHHLAAEVVGRYARDPRAFGALALSAETASPTTTATAATGYGLDNCFARQVEAHAVAGDVLMCMSTSGRSPNVLAAARTARAAGVRVWAMTGPTPNPLARCADAVLSVSCEPSPCIQDAHQVAVYLLCLAFGLAAEDG